MDDNCTPPRSNKRLKVRLENHHSEEQEQSEKMENVDNKMDSGYAWIVLLSTIFINFLIDGIRLGTYGNLELVIEDVYATSGSTATSILSIAPAAGGLIGVVCSILIEKFGCRAVAICGGLVSALAFAVNIWVRNIYFLCFAHLIQGSFYFHFDPQP